MKLKITVNGVAYEVEVEVLEEDQKRPELQSVALPPPSQTPVTPAARPKSSSKPAGNNDLTSPLSGLLVEYRVSVGDSVESSTVVALIEAMKMRTEIAAGRAGKVSALHVKPGESLREGDPLLSFEG